MARRVDPGELRRQMVDAFEGADYPITSPMDLVPALPQGPSTRFESGDFSMTAMELNTKLSGGDFPYRTVDAFVDDVLIQLAEAGHIPEPDDDVLRTVVYGGDGGDDTEVYDGSAAASHCPACGVDLQALDRPSYCPACGVDLQALDRPSYCPACGADLQALDRPSHCPACGAALDL